MNDQIQLLRKYVRMAWPHRWSALVVSLLVSVGGWIYVFTIPDVYEVQAKIFVDTRSMLRPLLKGLAVDVDTISSEARLMQRTLLTRPNLEKVARQVDLDLDARTDIQFSNLVDSLMTRISISRTKQDNIYSIAYTDQDPVRTKRIVDELLNTFLETALGATRIDTISTQKFLDDQIQIYEKRLIEAEERLKEFKQRNVGQMPGSHGTYFEKLERERAILAQAELELREASNRAASLRRQLEGAQPVLGMMGNQHGFDPNFSSQYDGRIATLTQQLDQVLLHYTEKHPEVIGLQRQIEALSARRLEEQENWEVTRQDSPAGFDSHGNLDPMYREIELALAHSDAEVAALATRVKARRSGVDELENSVDTIPEIEAELKRLDRDYSLNRAQFDSLLKRRESARMAEEVDQKAEDIKLKVIEPPRIPLVPSGPDRAKYLTGVLFGALGVGIGVAFLLSQLSPRFYSGDELKAFAQLPILGVVSHVFSSRQRIERRMEMAVFATVLMGLISMYGGLIALENSQFDLHTKISSLVERFA